MDPLEFKKPPNLDEVTIADITRRLYGLTVKSHHQLTSYLDRNYHVLVDQQSDNRHINRVSADGYVLKITNSRESRDPQCFDAVHSLLQHLDTEGILVHTPLPNTNGKFHSLETFEQDQNREQYRVRLFTFIPGKILSEVECGPDMIYDIGKKLGQLHLALKNAQNPFIKNRTTSFFSLTQIPDLEKNLPLVTDETDRHVCREVIEAFRSEVVPQYDKLQKGLIHGDAHDENIIKTTSNLAFIDFTLATNSCYIFDLGTICAFLMAKDVIVDTMEVGGHFLAGYLTEMDLKREDRNVLLLAIAGRMVQSLLMGLHLSRHQPDNDYMLVSQTFWTYLRKLWSWNKDDVIERWRQVATTSYNSSYSWL